MPNISLIPITTPGGRANSSRIPTGKVRGEGICLVTQRGAEPGPGASPPWWALAVRSNLQFGCPALAAQKLGK